MIQISFMIPAVSMSWMMDTVGYWLEEYWVTILSEAVLLIFISYEHWQFKISLPRLSLNFPLAAVLIYAFVVAVLATPAIVFRDITTVLIGASTLMAAIAFHLFSVGNTVYSCGTSLEDAELFRKGTEISQNAMYTLIAGGLVFGTAIGFHLNPPVPAPFSTGQVLLIPLLGANSLFIHGILRHSTVHTWYNEVEREIQGADWEFN